MSSRSVLKFKRQTTQPKREAMYAEKSLMSVRKCLWSNDLSLCAVFSLINNSYWYNFSRSIVLFLSQRNNLKVSNASVYPTSFPGPFLYAKTRKEPGNEVGIYPYFDINTNR